MPHACRTRPTQIFHSRWICPPASHTSAVLQILTLAPWWWWEAQPFDFVARGHHHDHHRHHFELHRSRIFLRPAVPACCPALPVLAGATTALFAYHAGAGPIGAVLVGMIVGVVTLVGGQIAVAVVRSSLIRAAIALFFVVPAAIAGYYAARGLARISVPAEGWRDALALIGAIIVGTAAWTRITPVAPTRGGEVIPPSAQPPPASANRGG